MGKNYTTEYELIASDDEEWKANDDYSSDEVEQDQSASRPSSGRGSRKYDKHQDVSLPSSSQGSRKYITLANVEHQIHKLLAKFM